MSLDTVYPTTQRRQFPRIELDAPLSAVDLCTREDVQILDVSHGGLRTLSAQPGLPGMYHTVRVDLADGTRHDVRATPVHSHRAPGILRRFVVGWRALPDAASQASLRALVDWVTTVSSFADGVPFGAVDLGGGRSMTTPTVDAVNLEDPRTHAIVLEALAVRLDPEDAAELDQATVLPAWVPARRLTLPPPRADARSRWK